MATTALHIVHRLAAPAMARLLRPTVTGTHDLPSDGGVLLAVNHASNLDNYLLSAVSPRPVAYLGKQELARVKGLPQTADTVGKIPNALKGQEERNR